MTLRARLGFLSVAFLSVAFVGCFGNPGLRSEHEAEGSGPGQGTDEDVSSPENRADAGPVPDKKTSDGGPVVDDGGWDTDGGSDGGNDAATTDAAGPTCVTVAAPTRAFTTSGDPLYGTTWKNLDELVTADGHAATASLAYGQETSTLLVWQLGFAVPSNATITGVEATVTRRASVSTTVKDQDVYLYAGGDMVASRARASAWPVNFGTVTYGGPTDTWGMSLTPAIVNAPTFGAKLSAVQYANGGGPTNVAIDVVTVSVRYCLP